MSRRRMAQLLVAVVSLAMAVAMVWGRGVSGRQAAVETATRSMASIRFEPLGAAEVNLEVDQMMAWALERSRPGRGGRELPRGEGGAVRFRTRWAGGGEATVTPDGTVWLVRRPLPTEPGPDLFPTAAEGVAREVLGGLVSDADRFRVTRVQSFREGGHLWHRVRLSGGSGPLPAGWQRDAEVEVAGSTVVSLVRRVHPLGTDLGVVASRTGELRVLRAVALVTLALVVIGVLLAGAEGLAFHERLMPFRGVAAGGAVAFFAAAAGDGAGSALLAGFAAAAAVTVMPVWTSLPAPRLRWGVPVGVVAAAVVGLAPALVNGAGGWMPGTVAIEVDVSPFRLVVQAWQTALVEESLLRGALPGIAAPLTGWWGGALVGVFAGALLHPLPAVPLVAAIAVEGVLGLGMAVAARRGGVAAAVAARGTCEALLRRAAYPAGLWWSLAVLVPIAVGLLLARPRREG